MSTYSKTYRVYCFDADRGVVSADFVNAASDDAAIAMTKAAGFGSKCEIWDGKRLIGIFEKERHQA